LEAAAVALGEDHLGGAMAADVVEAAQIAVEPVRDQDWLVEDGRGLQVAHARQLIRAGDQLPGAGEDALALALEDGVVQVGTGRQRESAGEILARAHRSTLRYRHTTKSTSVAPRPFRE
jgi:hypothetical protein